MLCPSRLHGFLPQIHGHIDGKRKTVAGEHHQPTHPQSACIAAAAVLVEIDWEDGQKRAERLMGFCILGRKLRVVV